MTRTTSKNSSESFVLDNRIVKSAKHIRDSKIDFSDISASTDEELSGAKRVGRPLSGKAKQ